MSPPRPLLRLSPLLLLLLLVLQAPPAAHAQWTASPTRYPTPAPTPAPLTINCDLAAYQLAANGSDSCLSCRRDFACAWCVPDNAAAQPFCFDNRVATCPGRMGSYGLDICAQPLSPAMAAAVFAIVILLPLLCCAGCCFVAFRLRASRRPPTTAVLVPASALQGVRPPTPLGPGVVMNPYPPSSYPGGGNAYANPAYSYGQQPQQQPGYGQQQQQQPVYYSGPAAAAATTTAPTSYPMGQSPYATTISGGSVSPPPPPPYPGTQYGYGGQPARGAYM